MFAFVVMYVILWYVTAKIEIQQNHKVEGNMKIFKRNIKQNGFFLHGVEMRVLAEAQSNIVECNLAFLCFFSYQWHQKLNRFILYCFGIDAIPFRPRFFLFFSRSLSLSPLFYLAGAHKNWKIVLGYTEYVKLVKWNFRIFALIQL